MNHVSHLNGSSALGSPEEPVSHMPRDVKKPHTVASLRRIVREREKQARKAERRAETLTKTLARLDEADKRLQLARESLDRVNTEVSHKVGARWVTER